MTTNTSATWGRASKASFYTTLNCLGLLIGTPLTVLYFYVSAFMFDCSLLAPIQAFMAGSLSFREMLPPFSLKALTLLFGWITFQVVLACLPNYIGGKGGDLKGAITPAGNQLTYRINGLQSWGISVIFFLVGAYILKWFSPAVVFDNWAEMLWGVNILGFSLALFAYIKSKKFPSHPEDRKYSGNALYDFFMGVELNPRFGPIDLKLFFNGRPGIIGWTIINLSFAAAQYAKYGMVTNSMLLVNLLQGLYVVYFFYKEAWYLKTIDIHHDHFGWMLAWGDAVWLPYMYTLQGLYLVFNPVELSVPYALFVLVFGLVGFYIFASSNNQKDYFRESGGKGLIWGKQAKSLKCEYATTDGTLRESNLLLSGWWGFARHLNYTGDLILSLAYSLACGFDSPFPYFYFVFLAILLIHRSLRDEKRCQDKYGDKWTEYTAKVPYRLIPGIW